MNVKKIASLLPGLLTVCVVAISAAFLVTHPPQPTAQPAAPAPAAPPAAGGSTQAPAPAPPAPATATPLSGPGPSAPAVAQSAPPGATPSPAAPATAPTPPAAPKASAGQHGFRVQAGVFRNRVYAEDLMRQLREKGYGTTLAGGPLLRVLVGPAMSRADAERLAAKVRASGFDAIVTAVP